MQAPKPRVLVFLALGPLRKHKGRYVTVFRSISSRVLPFGGSQMNRRGLRGDQFARVENLLPGRSGYIGRDSELGNRLFVDAVI
jgi:hypothetical protein